MLAKFRKEVTRTVDEPPSLLISNVISMKIMISTPMMKISGTVGVT
jgi:hypothetical protein